MGASGVFRKWTLLKLASGEFGNHGTKQNRSLTIWLTKARRRDSG
jgi:hypothetical protein